MPLDINSTAALKSIGLTESQITKFEKIKAVRLPMKATLKNMGFDPKLVAKLPANVQRLSKADLLALGGWGGKLSTAGAKISVNDIQRIKDVLGGGVLGGGSPLSIDIYCCCCPCCCAASVTDPFAIEKSISYSVN